MRRVGRTVIHSLLCVLDTSMSTLQFDSDEKVGIFLDMENHTFRGKVVFHDFRPLAKSIKPPRLHQT